VCGACVRASVILLILLSGVRPAGRLGRRSVARARSARRTGSRFVAPTKKI